MGWTFYVKKTTYVCFNHDVGDYAVILGLMITKRCKEQQRERERERERERGRWREREGERKRYGGGGGGGAGGQRKEYERYALCALNSQQHTHKRHAIRWKKMFIFFIDILSLKLNIRCLTAWNSPLSVMYIYIKMQLFQKIASVCALGYRNSILREN